MGYLQDTTGKHVQENKIHFTQSCLRCTRFEARYLRVFFQFSHHSLGSNGLDANEPIFGKRSRWLKAVDRAD